MTKSAPLVLTTTDGEILYRWPTKTHKALGGPGSGNFGHAGRPGEVGGSGEGNGPRTKDEFINQMVVNIEASSRSAHGEETEMAGKPSLSLKDTELIQRVDANTREAAAFAWAHRNDALTTPEDVHSVIEGIGTRVNNGLVPTLYREHETGRNVPVAQMRSELTTFERELATRIDHPDVVATAAWVEREFDARIHPFADGVGRSTKLLSGLVLARAGHALPRYGDRTTYYAKAVQSVPVFTEYYRGLFTKPRTAAARDHSPLHAVADAHAPKIASILRYAFVRGRKALGANANVDAATAAIRAALADALPNVLLATLEDGGKVGAQALRKLVAAGGAGSGNFGHAGRPGEVGGSAESGHADALNRASSTYTPIHVQGRDTREQFSDGHGHYTAERAELHHAIIAKYMQGTTPVETPTSIILGGGPASGKSSLVEAEHIPNTVMVDVDKIRTELPEYKERVGKDTTISAFTHEESSDIAKQLAHEAAIQNRNTLLDGTGDGTIEKLGGKVAMLRAEGSRVVGKYVTVDTEVAVARAAERAAKTGRYVPETFLRETHAGVSRVVPEAIRQGLFDEFELYHTNGPKPALVATAKGRDLVIRDPQAWESFVKKGKP